MTTKDYLNGQALKKERPNIVKKLANPDKVAVYLFSIHLFDDEMKDEVLQEPEREAKTRKILDTLNYRGPKAATGLHEAFMHTSNEPLAKLLAPYIIQIQSEDNKNSPEEWPPRDDDQKKMVAEPVTRITDLTSALYIHQYNDEGVYKMQKRIRGKVFIINNETFENKKKLPYRQGSDVDAKNLESLFTQLQFEVVIAKDQKAQEMIDFLTNERDKVNWHDMECVVLIIMSHGEKNDIYGTGGKLTKLKDMTDIFSSSQCPELKEKPRLVFVQACRGENTETDFQVTKRANQKDKVGDAMKDMTVADNGEHDTLDAVPGKVTGKTVHSATHFFIAYATPEGTPAYRNIESGSWFLNAIVWTFKYHAHTNDIHQLLSKVNSLVSKGRNLKGEMTVSEVRHSLLKAFYFFPGVYDDPPELVDS